MAALPQLSLTPYSGLEKENFREFEHLLRSILAVAAVPQAQQANFLQLHLRDAALRYFQTLPVATRADLDHSLTALRDHFCNPRLQELHVLKLENLKFDPKTDNPENFLVTLQTKALKAYPDPNPPAVAPIDGAAPDAAVEQTRFDSETARRAEIIHSAQQARSTQIRSQFIKNMPGWLRTKLLEQPENTTVEDLCIFARKQLSIYNLCKVEDSVMDAFSEVRPSVSDTLVTALTKLSHSQETMDNRLNEMSKKLEEQATNFTTQLQNQQNQNNSQRGSQKAIAEIEEIIVVGIAAITVETEVEVTKVEDDLGRTITAEITISQIKITKIQILIRIKIVSNNGQIIIRKTFNKEIPIKVHRKLHLKFYSGPALHALYTTINTYLL